VLTAALGLAGRSDPVTAGGAIVAWKTENKMTKRHTFRNRDKEIHGNRAEGKGERERQSETE